MSYKRRKLSLLVALLHRGDVGLCAKQIALFLPRFGSQQIQHRETGIEFDGASVGGFGGGIVLQVSVRVAMHKIQVGQTIIHQQRRFGIAQNGIVLA